MSGTLWNSASLDRLLERSEELHAELAQLLQDEDFDGAPRGLAVLGMCSASFEHAHSLRLLFAVRNPTSATSLMRLQFEAVVRGMWALWVATEGDIAKLTAALASSSESEASRLPSGVALIRLLEQHIGNPVPAAAYEMVARFKKASWPSLNSYVHGGIHPYHRQTSGFPVPLACQVVTSSNALSTMGAMLLAHLTGNQAIASKVGKVQPAFADCLPELLN